ncbi:MAG: bifunctional UDP-N-acetylglucosamine diphosphorylase/glucosamine-1-phosphate N-acetyltransferase GlmU [Gammaproteobacteria bacterium]
MKLGIIILAAGAGTRMRSSIPKILHSLAGKPLLTHVYEVANQLDSTGIHIIYGHGGNRVKESLQHLDANWIEQSEQLGTGHAVAQALPALKNNENVLVLYGDVPLISVHTLQQLIGHADQQQLGLLTAQVDEPSGYGRIVRNDKGQVQSIVEEKDASEDQRTIKEINTGIMVLPVNHLTRWINGLENKNVQKEYYLTDVIAMAVNDGIKINTVSATTNMEISGVNDRIQLAQLERFYQEQRASDLMKDGVTLFDPQRFDLRGSLKHGHDIVIDVNVIIEGEVSLGDGVQIGPNTVIKNSTIGNGVKLMANCVIEDAVMGDECRIGPFARIRPETTLADHVHVGNFVEIKKSKVSTGSKINHLSYVGDSSVGSEVNIGAGTITCNYDGAKKHHTTIGNKVFIGSDTQLIAPVTVGDGATIGAGSTITRDVPADALTLSRSPQKTRAGWQRPVKKK